MPATDPRTPLWLKTARRRLARMDPETAVTIAEDLLEQARARQEEAALRARLAPLFERRRSARAGQRPLVLRLEDRVPPPFVLLPDQRVDL